MPSPHHTGRVPRPMLSLSDRGEFFVLTEAPAAVAAHRSRGHSFAALRHRGYRAYFIGNALAMLADSVEHVISYWVIFQKFHSPALAGFAVISHWVPYLLFGVWSGALADRYDPRRIIQLGMVLFMCCSATWGILFVTGRLRMWHAVAILVVHGFASLFWGPASQVLIHDIVEVDQLPSAVRLAATARYLGLLAGPALGAFFLLALGPGPGIFTNILIYLPLTLWLVAAPYGPRYRKEPLVTSRIRGLADLTATLVTVARIRVIAAMTLVTGAYSLLVGNAYQAQMPEFARDFGHGDPGVLYSMLLGADASGAFLAGIVLEGTGRLQPRTQTVFVLALLWSLAIGAFAVVPLYPLALCLLFVAGFLELSFNSMAQALVQLHAPSAVRGRVIGLYSMSAVGLRAFSGATVGVGGSFLGIHASLAAAALALFATVALLMATMARSPASAAG